MQLPPKKIPRTIENTRELDETICKPDDDEVRVFSLNQMKCYLNLITMLNIFWTCLGTRDWNSIRIEIIAILLFG